MLLYDIIKEIEQAKEEGKEVVHGVGFAESYEVVTHIRKYLITNKYYSSLVEENNKLITYTIYMEGPKKLMPYATSIAEEAKEKGKVTFTFSFDQGREPNIILFGCLKNALEQLGCTVRFKYKSPNWFRKQGKAFLTVTA